MFFYQCLNIIDIISPWQSLCQNMFIPGTYYVMLAVLVILYNSKFKGDEQIRHFILINYWYFQVVFNTAI